MVPGSPQSAPILKGYIMILRILMFLASVVILQARVNVVASTTDLADIAKQVGGEFVSCVSIARGSQDPHYVEVLPSFMIKVKQADLYLMVGMELDRWAEQIIDGSRNRKLRIVDCSENIVRLEVPTRKVDASMGDIHPNGNPHYWLDPENGKAIARTISENLKAVDPQHSETYEHNLQAFLDAVSGLETQWAREYAGLRGQRVIFYHNTWPYFNNYFGIIAAAFIEPKPGIMPTPVHLDHLIHQIEDQQIAVIAMEPYFSLKAPEFLNEKTGVSIVGLAQSVDARSGAGTYQEMLAYNLAALAKALTP